MSRNTSLDPQNPRPGAKPAPPDEPPYRYDRTHPVADVVALADAAGGIEAG